MVAICNASATNSRGEKENLLFFSFQSVCSSYLARNISKKGRNLTQTLALGQPIDSTQEVRIKTVNNTRHHTCIITSVEAFPPPNT